MSWFYEAIQRAERKGPKPGKAIGEDLAQEDGDSFLAEIEALSSLSVKTPSDKEERTRATVTTEEAPKAAEAPVQTGAAVMVASPEAPAERNGFRHLTLPIKENSRLVFHTDAHGAAAEQFRFLRRSLTQEFSKGGVLMVTSPTVGDGKTLTSINLCSCLAELGEPTLLIEADMRRPTVGKVLSCTAEAPGIEDVLNGGAQPTEAIYLIEELRFHAAMMTSVPRDPSKLINGGGFRKFLAWAGGHFRWIVLDASPVLPTADVSDLLPQIDGVLLVIRAESTPRELSRRSVEILGKHVRGVIFNEATVHSNAYYRYLSDHYQGAAAKEI